MADTLKKCVADYLAAFKRKDVKALHRAARLSKQVGFSKERWTAEMSRQAKGDPELEAMLEQAKASIKAEIEANSKIPADATVVARRTDARHRNRKQKMVAEARLT